MGLIGIIKPLPTVLIAVVSINVTPIKPPTNKKNLNRTIFGRLRQILSFLKKFASASFVSFPASRSRKVRPGVAPVGEDVRHVALLPRLHGLREPGQVQHGRNFETSCSPMNKFDRLQIHLVVCVSLR